MALKRALTIDDELETRRNLRSGLTGAGWQVEEAANGLDGLERIHRLAAEGNGVHAVITEAILPDLDTKLMLRALRAQYPALPFIVLTAYPEEEHRAALLELTPLVYMDKPVDMAAVCAALDEFDTTQPTGNPAPLVCATEPPRFEAYVFIRIRERARAAELYDHFRSLEGVRITNAVRGDFDLVLRLNVPTADELTAAIARVQQVEGVEFVSIDKLEQPRLSLEIRDFVDHYEQVAIADRAKYVRMHETNAYLVIDIDRYQLERIYTSILLTEGVISCQVTGGSKLIVMMSGAVQPEVMRRVLRKIATMDGIRRVREAPVINIHS